MFAQETLLDQGFINVLSSVFVSCDGVSPGTCPAGTSAAANFTSIKGVSVVAELDAFSDTGSAGIVSATMQFSLVPEPGSLALFALGIAGLVVLRRNAAA